ncbi:peroxiredoxin [Paralysiella testudinis]|uniref:Thioredoxin peroxidase n=1 Tax=Paralysiella testudinis TaxID=2809020 RepID=A0A892ZJH8_9NEIS|nr:peroxiredoxin [Paralysiella testudinis]QRQ81866.1 peroxiredoxin [Paralysiella testudinis]
MAVLVNKPAPFFHDSDKQFAAVLGNGDVVENFNFAAATEGKYALVFFYPLDFTFVCPSEIIAHDHRLAEFKARNVEVIAVSIDSQFTHAAWRNTPVNQGGIGPVGFTMVADIAHEIAKAYDVESEGGVAFRGSFLIDKDGVVQHQVVNNLPLGRNVDEMLRMVDALQFTEQHGEVCPAGWNKGDKGMKADAAGVAAYLSESADKL